MTLTLYRWFYVFIFVHVYLFISGWYCINSHCDYHSSVLCCHITNQEKDEDITTSQGIRYILPCADLKLPMEVLANLIYNFLGLSKHIASIYEKVRSFELLYLYYTSKSSTALSSGKQ